MPRIIYSQNFINDFEGLHDFLNQKNPLAAQRFSRTLEEKLDVLASIPEAFTFLGPFRLYFLAFATSGYAILYEYNQTSDTLVLLRIKHQKEAGF
jgi:plasmid stabilization system protein ParE